MTLSTRFTINITNAVLGIALIIVLATSFSGFTNTGFENDQLQVNIPVRIVDGLRLLRASDEGEEYHIFVSGQDTNDLGLSSAFDYVVVFASNDMIENPNNMNLMFWNGSDSRPILTLNEGGFGRVSLFERSLVVGDGKGVKALDANYTLGTASYPNLAFDTTSNGADMGIEHDAEIRGKAFTTAIRARDTNGLGLYDNDGSGIFIDDGGFAGIGTSNPSSPLQFGAPNDETNVYVQIDSYNGWVPPIADCDSGSERGRMKFDSSGDILYVCSGGNGWVSTTLN